MRDGLGDCEGIDSNLFNRSTTKRGLNGGHSLIILSACTRPDISFESGFFEVEGFG